jgi:hypothetical protein
MSPATVHASSQWHASVDESVIAVSGRKVAVLGGGIFGCSAAVALARAGHTVELFEQQATLMNAASMVNQYRLHRGYHYPRSSSTGVASRAAAASFRQHYGAAIIDGGRHFYAIARQGSKLDGAAFMNFCESERLAYRVVDNCSLVNYDTIEVVVDVEETRFDPWVLRELASEQMNAAGVRCHLGVRAPDDLRRRFDFIVIAGYASTNELLQHLGCATSPYQFEVCEKPVVAMPSEFTDTGIVVMDGPFGSIDPFAATEHHVLGSVDQAIHYRTIGARCEVPAHLQSVLNAGVVAPPPFSRCSGFITSGSEHIPSLAHARHVGSMFTVRAVQPNVDATDERLTSVQKIDAQVARVFSGKIVTAIDAALQVCAIVADG